MNETINPYKNPIDSKRRPWRDATRIIRGAAARLITANESSSKRQGNEPLVPTPLERMGLRTIDFGAARLVEADSIVEAIVGPGICSAKYMSPERSRGHRPDSRSDVYVLTCRYYELLTGELPFTAADEATLLYEHCYTTFPDAASKVSDLPNGVLQVLARGSEKDPADRYQSAAEMVADLNTLLETSGTSGAGRRLYAEMPVGTAPISPGNTRAKPLFKRKMVYAVLAIVVAGAAWALLKFHEPNPPASPLDHSVAQAPRYAPAPIPATTQSAAGLVLIHAESASPATQKAIPIPEPSDPAVHLHELGIKDKPMMERGVLLRAFEFTRPIPPSEWPALVAQMGDVEYVLFRNQSGTDEAVSQVAKAPMLVRLSLGGEPVTDKGIAFLNGHPSLQRLDLANTAISGAAMDDIASIQNLSALDIRKTAVRGPCWSPLRRSHVSSLWLGDNPIEDSEIADFAGHLSLSYIQLSNTRVTNAAIDTLASMPNFRQGDFAGTRVDEDGVAKLSRIQNLVTLELSGCPIGESGLAPLSNLKKLRRLVIRNLVLSDPALNGIAECSQMEGLDLSGCRFNASGLTTLGRLSALRSIRLGGTSIASPGGPTVGKSLLEDLKQTLPNLVVEGTPDFSAPE